MQQIDSELKKLILDDEFTNIQGLVNEEINLMSILRVAHKELQHSNLLAWLFDPKETHGLNDYFIKEFIKLYFKENEYQDLGSTSSKLSVFDFVNLDFKDLQIRREHKNIDILILSKENGLCIMIENKIYAKETKGQLKKYREYIENEYSDFKYKVFIFLSLFEQDISDTEKEYYIQLTYQHIKNLLTQILDSKNISVEGNTRFVITQYLQTLRSLMNENEEIEKTAKDLYKKYKSAFDLVFKYASPSASVFIPHKLNELIENSTSINSFNSSKSYIRFQPNFLYQNIKKLRSSGFITKDDDLKNNWLFLFEFHITRSYIYFDIKIGEYSDSACREKLYALFMENTDVFDKVEKANGKLAPSWHLSFQRKIVTASEYNNYLESEDDSLDEIIENKFDILINDDLPKIQKIIEGAINI